MDRYLVLENGQRFRGKGFGADREVLAQIVFNTTMIGYLELLSDPAGMGQAVVSTFPLIGNYGFIPEDLESGAFGPAALICREICSEPSNFRSQGNLCDFLRERGIVGLYDIDTRALTRVLREKGTMNGIITSDPDSVDITKLAAHRIENAVQTASVREAEKLGQGGKCRVAVIDYGKKESICRSLLERGCELTLFPWDAPAEALLAAEPDGIMLTGGPGDPRDNEGSVETLRALLSKGVPTMAVGLGHQLLALAGGFETASLKYGHRGANQPVRSVADGKVYITAQNHGYVVSAVDPGLAEETFTNINDGSNAGLRYKSIPALSVQFLPATAGGGQDTGFLYDEFIQMAQEVKSCR